MIDKRPDEMFENIDIEDKDISGITWEDIKVLRLELLPETWRWVGVIFLLLASMVIGIERGPERKAARHNPYYQYQQQYFQHRHRSIEKLVNVYSQMHKDAGIEESYKKSISLVKKINPEKSPIYSGLGQLYYSAANLFICAAYAPIVINMAGRSGVLVMMHRKDLPDNFVISKDIKGDSVHVVSGLMERNSYHELVDNHYEQLRKAYKQDNMLTTVMTVPILQKDMIDAIFFYMGVMELMTEEQITQSADPELQAQFEIIYTDESTPSIHRFFLRTVFQEKQFFNQLVSLYNIYAQLAGMQPDMDVTKRLAESMDAILYGDHFRSPMAIMERLVQASAVVDSITVMTVESLERMRAVESGS